MIKTLSLSAAFLLALSPSAQALTILTPSGPPAINENKDAGSPVQGGETAIRYETGPSFSLTGVRKDMTIEYRMPLSDRVSTSFGMTYSYDGNNVEKTQNSSAMIHFRLRF